MHFGVAQRFAALIAGVKQTSLKLSAKASAGLPRSVRGYAGLQRGIASQCPGVCSFLPRDGLGTWGVRAMYRAPRVHLLSGSWRTSRRLCFVSERTVGSKRFAFGELAHIKALAFCVQAARVSNIRAVPRDCLAGPRGMQVCDVGLLRRAKGHAALRPRDCLAVSRGRDYEFRVLDPSALFAKKSQKNC